MGYNQVRPTSLNRGGNKSYHSSDKPSSSSSSSPHYQYPPQAPRAPPPPPPSQQAAPQPGLPSSLTTFVEECHQIALSRNFTTEQTAQMQSQLRILIQQADNEKKIWTNDWTQQKVPALHPGSPLQLQINSQVDHRFAKSNNIYNNNNKTTSSAKVGTTNYRVHKDSDPLSSKNAKKARAQRFERELSLPASSSSPVNSSYHNDFDEDSFNNKPLVGLSQTYLKNFFRLTSAPDPMNVRPLSILKRTLEILLEKYDRGEKYTYICDQFKSMRQDLRVQNIQEEFTVKVYETHARIAIENGDLGEFNQCQTMLSSLYSNTSIHCYNKLEFLSYKILYQLFTANYDSILAFRLKLTSLELNNEYIKIALSLFKAMTTNNYHQLFKIYSLTIKTTRKLMDNFIDAERIKALAVICSAYNILSLEFLLTEFRFRNQEDCLNFFAKYKLEQFMELKNEHMFLNTAKAKPIVMGFQAKAKKVDIKGQI